MGPVVVSGNYAYVPCGPSGLQILDVSDPAQPRRVSRYVSEFQFPQSRVAILGEYAYLTGARLEVINIRDPHHPTRVGVTDSGSGSVGAFAVSATHAYLASYGEGGVQILAISDPKEPRWVGTVPVNAAALAVVGTHLYVATWERFEVWGVATPSQPERVSTMPLNGRAQSLALAGNHAVVACEFTEQNRQFTGSGLQIIDLTEPGNLRTVGSYPTDAPATGVAVAGQRALVVAGQALHVVDLSDPARPQRLGTYDKACTPSRWRLTARLATSRPANSDSTMCRSQHSSS